MLLQENALRVEIRPAGLSRGLPRNRTFYVFNCINCKRELYIRFHYLAGHKGTCKSCFKKVYPKRTPSGIPRKHYRKTNPVRPFQYLLTILKNVSRKREIPLNLSYEDFLEFTKTENCFYCESIIRWFPHQLSHERNSVAYNLDRKNSDLGYEKNNLVVCCFNCNKTKNSHLTYEEMVALSPTLKQIVKARGGHW